MLTARRIFSIGSAAVLALGLLTGPPGCEAARRSTATTESPRAAESVSTAAVPSESAAANVAGQAGFYRTRVGAVAVTVLSDGTVALDVTHGLALNAKPGEVESLLARSFQKSPIDASFNVFVIQMAGRTFLIDSGCAEQFGPTAGKLALSLAQAGLRPEDITDVLLTHMHPDHVGGLVANGQRTFVNATVRVDQRELDHWMNETLGSKATGMQATFFAAARASLEPYTAAGRVKTFAGATEIAPGLRAQPAYGHTPGHSMYVLESKGDKLLFWGDLIHIAAVQFDDPAVGVGFDSDPAAAVETRKRALAEAAENGYLVAHDHAAFPGLGHVGRQADAYRWVSAAYVNDAAKP